MVENIPRRTDRNARPRGRWRPALLVLALTAWPALADQPPETAADAERGALLSSSYMTAGGGTRLAVDVALPAEHRDGDRRPALVELTRYWRASEDPETGAPNPSLDVVERAALEAGYAVVQVDVRGSGASFGHRLVEYGPQEVKDGWHVLEWISRQPWSNGRVGAQGISYTGTTAELLAASGHPALRAVVPGWSDFDAYRSPARPYGLIAADFIETWGGYVAMLDRNDPALGGLVKRVDGDRDGSLRAAAVAEHRANPDVAAAIGAAEFRDQRVAGSAYSFVELSVLHWQKQIEASGVPMLVFASWLDAGTAEGALWRLANLSNQQYVVILASMHGGGAHASPYVVSGQPVPPVPSVQEQVEMRLAFFDHFLKEKAPGGREAGLDDWPRVRYFNLGEEAFHTSDTWPPAGFSPRRFFLQAAGKLAAEAPAEPGADSYEVDFGVSTGTNNRWMTQMGEPVLSLDDRAAMDERMLTYTTPPLDTDLQITGFPAVRLWLRSTHADGAVLLYLHDVAPDGRSRYLSEGGLRLLHRRVDAEPGFEAFGPVRSFEQADAEPMVPGERVELRIRLHPTSVRLAKGHRLRLAIAGADADIFRRLPAEGTPTLTIDRGGEHASWLELPVESAAGR